MADTDEDNSENLPQDSELIERDEGEEFFEDLNSISKTLPYISNDYISCAKRTENGTVPMNILELHHSFGYNCQRYFNFCVADSNTIIFASGNLIHFFNTVEKKISFRRSFMGGGIGHIVKNPVSNHIAVGENGNDPPIIIYEWPSLEIVTILWHGTTRLFSHLDFSPDGKLLASQGGEPDYLLTIWNWQQSKITLRFKSHGQDIINVMFSPFVFGHLTTSGLGHIKFWKMSKTFTGLKLKGELGRFGKTEISDIIGVYPMPDEKVVSGCEWGNILIWDEGLIKFEVCRKNRKPCHSGVVTQFEYNNGELISIGMDGWIRMWFYDTIDQADPSDEDRFLEIEPVYEFSICEKENNSHQRAMLMSIQKQEPDNPESTFWYAQDGNGGLWIIDLCTFQTPESPRKLLNCHAGPITDIASADWGPFIASCGKDNNLFIYNYEKKEMILDFKFNDIGSRIIWLPCAIEATGSTLICAFESGVIRIIVIELEAINVTNREKGQFVKFLQVLKPHNRTITAMSLNPSNNLLVTGSEDSTIFVFLIDKTNPYPSLIPIGFIKTPSSVTCITCKPESMTILLGCSKGNLLEIELPNEKKYGEMTTYELVDCKTRIIQFQSVKSEIRRELVKNRNEQQRKRKVSKLENVKSNNPEMEVDETTHQSDFSDQDEQLPEIFIPKVPNDVLLVYYTSGGTICLSMSGYDAGYLYEYSSFESNGEINPKPTRSRMVFEADDTEIRSCLFKRNKYLFLGMEHGEIRVCRVNPNDPMDFSDYWILPMHDNFNGFIPKMLLSYDHNVLLTCGHDGNLFSFCINDSDDSKHEVPVPKETKFLTIPDVDDIEELNYPTLETVVCQAKDDKILKLAQEKKNSVLALLQTYAQDFSKLMEKNRELLKSQQIPQEEFEIDPRITEELNNQLQSELNFVHRKMSFKVEKSKLRLKKLMDHFVEPITCLPFCVHRILKPSTKVYSFREHKLGDEYFSTYSKVTRLIAEKEKTKKSLDLQINQSIMEEEEEEKEIVHGVESFLKGLSSSTLEYKLGVEINQMLKKYRMRKARIEERKREWKTIYDSKPEPEGNVLNDNNALEKAEKTIGDYKFKNSPDSQKMNQGLDNVLNKYKQLLDCRKKIHYLREDFNNKLKFVRAKKLALQKESQDLVNKLKQIQYDILEKNRKPLPLVFTIDYNAEFPEKELEIEKYKAMIVKVEEVRKSKKPIFLDFSQKNIQVNVSQEVFRNLIINEQNETPWEREMKRIENFKRIHEQNFLISEIENKYQSLDDELDELEKSRVEVTMESEYLNLFLLTLHQELIILRNFEATENSLTETVNGKIKDCIIGKKKIQSITGQIENKNKEILKLQEKIKELSVQYRDLINENKFRDFLLRIFKKKFKQPKENASSSSSSSETTSDEDDADSIDSREIGILHYDENILPLGCDKELYDAAFLMREHRYNSELQIRNEQKKIEGLRKDLGIENKKLKIMELELKTSQDNLKIFMQDKHEKLNSIDMTVILKFHQLQHFLSNSEVVANIRDCILFDRKKLSELYARVGELLQETNDELNKYKKSRTYLNRIKTECKQMETEIMKLKSNVKAEKINKFGQDISVNILYEAVLRSLIYDIKANLNSIVKSYDDQVNCVKCDYQVKMETLKNYLQSNTEKLSFLAVLEEEQLKLRKLLKCPPLIDEDSLSEFIRDIKSLKITLENQEHRKELLRNEIRNVCLNSG